MKELMVFYHPAQTVQENSCSRIMGPKVLATRPKTHILPLQNHGIRFLYGSRVMGPPWPVQKCVFGLFGKLGHWVISYMVHAFYRPMYKGLYAILMVYLSGHFRNRRQIVVNFNKTFIFRQNHLKKHYFFWIRKYMFFLKPSSSWRVN